MFRKKTEENLLPEGDVRRMIEAIDNIASGDFNEIDATDFNNPLYADKLNSMLKAVKQVNNPVVMRLNETMEILGDNTLIKDTLNQVETQTKSIQHMENASQHLESSIENISMAMGHIRDNAHDIISVSHNVTVDMNDSIKAVNASSKKIQSINNKVQDFKGKIGKIEAIVDLVKKVSNQSNLLALNASVEAARAGEAGRGFAVVADQVRQLSSSTSESADDIVNYVRELNDDIGRLAVSMDDTTVKLSEGNSKVEESLSDIERMNNQMVAINDAVNGIFADIDTQSSITTEFAKQVDSIAASYDKLSDNCMATGTHIYKIGRYIDTARSDMFRSFSNVTTQDMIRIFQIDHFILMWRVYNNAVGFETLKVTQLNNPDSCKLGKWMKAQTDTRITGSRQFKDLDAAHRQIHKYAVDSWNAKESGNVELALEYFQKCYDAFGVYSNKIEEFKSYMRTIGYTDETEKVTFRK